MFENGISDSAPLQFLASALVTFPGGAGTTPVLDGKGFVLIHRGASAQGSYILTFDPGIPGLAGAVEAIPELPFVVPADPNVRSIVTPLGLTSTGVATISVSYIPFATNPAVGAKVVEVVTTTPLGVPADIPNGFSIMVLRGYGGGPVL